jgi:endonuclease/exonuclease/phosphatase family metal-dependent hydrolase
MTRAVVELHLARLLGSSSILLAALKQHYSMLGGFMREHVPSCIQLPHHDVLCPSSCMPSCREHPVDWEAPKHVLAAREPRHGRRAALAATLHTPAGPLLVYNLHLEVRLPTAYFA